MSQSREERRTKNREYYLATKEKQTQQAKECRQRKKELAQAAGLDINEIQRVYYAAHRDEFNAKRRQYRQSHLEEVRAREAERRKCCDKDKHREAARRYAERRPEAAKAARERAKRLYELRQQGLTLAAIGKTEGISRERVRQIVKRYELSLAR